MTVAVLTVLVVDETLRSTAAVVVAVAVTAVLVVDWLREPTAVVLAVTATEPPAVVARTPSLVTDAVAVVVAVAVAPSFPELVGDAVTGRELFTPGDATPADDAVTVRDAEPRASRRASAVGAAVAVRFASP